MIGGGDTGTDCVGTSMRHRCHSLSQFEILPQPPLERTPDNPWPEWPKVYKLDYGQAEASVRFGGDPRTYLISTKKFVGDENGHVKELHTVEIEWVKGANGRFELKELPGTEKVWPAQLVLLALGFLGRKMPSWNSWELRVTRVPTSKPTTASFTQVSKVSLPPATCGAAKVWLYGPSMKAAALHANVTAGSWAKRCCRRANDSGPDWLIGKRSTCDSR